MAGVTRTRVGQIGRSERRSAVLLMSASIAVLAAGLAQPAAGADLYWDPNGATAGLGGAGSTWNTTNAFWNSDSTGGAGGTVTTWTNGAFDNAFFGGTVGTVTVSGTIDVHNITFNTSPYLLTGGTLNLGGTTPTITVSVNPSTSISSVLTGTAGLTKAGAGGLVLSGNNTYTGTTTISGGTIVVGANGTTGNLGAGAVINNGGLSFSRSDTHTVANNISGSGTLSKTQGAGTTILTGTNTYSGATTLNIGRIQLGDGGTTGTLGTGAVSTAAAGGLIFNRSDTLTVANAMSGQGTLTFAGSGTTIFTGVNTITGAAFFNAGTVQVGTFQNLSTSGTASAMTFNGGTLKTTGVIGNSRAVTLTGTGTFQTDANLTLSGVISGGGPLVKTGAASLILRGANTYGGTTTISAGTLQVGAGATVGALGTGAVINNATLAFNRTDTLTVANTISGSGGVTQAGTGATVLTATNAYTGATAVNAGTLRAGAAAGGQSFGVNSAVTFANVAGATLDLNGFDQTVGSLAGGGTTGGNVLLGAGRLTTGGANTDTSYAGVIGGAGGLTKTGSGVQILTGVNTYAGATNVNAGTLVINGAQTDATGLTTVASGAALGGSGTVGGDVVVQNGGRLAPGNSPGTLTIAGDLTLNATSVLDMEFGQAGVPGGPLNDLIVVGGDLTLDGTVDVTLSAGGRLDPGVYRVMSYGGTLTNNVLSIGATPAGSAFSVQTTVPGQVNLVNSGGLTTRFWDGAAGGKNDGAITGGAGVWQSPTGNDNWTNETGAFNSPWTDEAFAIFSGVGGVVTLDDSLGSVDASGLQFTVNGYSLTGDPLTLIGAEAVIRVGDGTAAGAAMTATIGSVLGGASRLAKADLGTLVLTGANTYSGGTLVAAGTLVVDGDQSAATGLAQVDSGGALAGSGVLGGGVTVNGVLSPGNAGVGELTINGALTLGASAVVNMDFGLAGVAGGALNDLIVVNGALTLDGTLNVAQTAGGAFGPGVYRVINYTGALTDNGLAVGALPSDAASVQTSIANQINLVVAPLGGGGGGGGGGDPDPDPVLPPGPGPGPITDPAPDPTPPPPPPVYNFWDGATALLAADSQVSGGDGVWQAGAGNANWTETSGATNGGYTDGTFAIFAGNGGVVTVDAGQGAVTASGLQFAADGYRVQGDDIVLSGSEAIVRVGDGTTAGAAFTATIASRLTGDTRLVKTDAGTLMLAGANSYTGGTEIQGGTVRGSATSFGVGAIRTDAALVIDQAADASFANAIDGSGTFTKTGAGRLTYTGSGGLSGLTTVAAGSLSVNGSLAQSAVTVRSAASLEGAGTVGATTLQGGATVVPGDGGIGALTVNGAFAQAAGATYQVQLDPDSNASDRILAGGAVSLADGAVLNVARTGTSPYRLGEVYTVLTAQGGVTGTYDLTGDVGMLSAFLGLTDRYDANNVYLTVAQVRAFEEVAETPNQMATATAVTGPVTEPLLYLADASAARAAFDRLSGEPHATLRGVLMTESQLVRDAAFGRLSCTQNERANCEDMGDRAAGWGQLIGGWGKIDGDGNAAGADHAAGGLVAGFDLPAGGWRLGAYAGYTRTDWDVDARAAAGDIGNYHAGVYAGRGWGALGLRLGGGQTWHQVSADRTAAFSGFSDRLKADYDGTTTQVFADVDYRLTAGPVTWTPFANVAHVRVRTDGFAEGGGAAALSVAGETMAATITTVGIRPSTRISLGSAKATLRGTLGWRHAFGDVASTSTNAFAGGDPFAVRGAPLARDAAVAEVGLDMGLGSAGQVSFTYGGQFSGRTTDQRLRLDLRVRF
jgi:fibronectin-binding autotransporter adhesin